MAVAIEDFKSITYIKTDNLTHGRTVNLMPMWDGQDWHLWIHTPQGFIDGKVIEAVEGDYVAKVAAKQSDLFVPFIHLMWQQASWPEICPLTIAISDDFHNMGTSVAKLRHFFDSRRKLPPNSLSRFARSELEYLIMICRSVFDLLQEIIAILWTKIELNNEFAEKRRRSTKLPTTFSRLLLDNKERPRTAAELESKYGLPGPLAAQYVKHAGFFCDLRKSRDRIVHGHGSSTHIFDTEQGFCVSPQTAPFSSFQGLRSEHHYNEHIVSVLPWLANTILQTIDACNGLVGAFAATIRLPPEIAPGYRILVRGPHNDALVGLLAVHSGGSPWWKEGEK